jgi:glycosyltransferase involved in cell wall biosynthesis
VQVSAVLFNDGWLASELRGLGITVAVVDERQHTPLGIIRFLTRFFRRHRVELIHTHRYKDNILGSIAAIFAGVPHVIRTVHGCSEPMRGWDWLKFQALPGTRSRRALVACGPRGGGLAAHGRRAEASGYRPGTLTSVHNGVDLSKIHPTGFVRQTREAIGLRRGDVVIGTAGRLTPVKGQEYLVRAAARIVQQESHARFLFIGSGPLEPGLRELARQLAVDHACVFVDPADRSPCERVRPDRGDGRLRPPVASRRHPDGAARSAGASAAGRGIGGRWDSGGRDARGDRAARRAEERTGAGRRVSGLSSAIAAVRAGSPFVDGGASSGSSHTRGTGRRCWGCITRLAHEHAPGNHAAAMLERDDARRIDSRAS